MNEALAIASFNLIAKVGLNTAILIMEGMEKAATQQDVIAALKAARDKSYDDYISEAKARLAGG